MKTTSNSGVNPLSQLIIFLSLTMAAAAGDDNFIVHNFGGSNGSEPNSVVRAPDGTLYGTAYWSGISNCGTLYKISTNGDFTLLKRFGGADGANPGGLAVSGETLFGATYAGGAAGFGTLFAIATDGTGYTVVKQFTGPDGANPNPGLLLADGVVYGTTYGGGNANCGTVFAIGTNGDHAVLKHLTGGAGDEKNPLGGLALSGTTLYGTTFGAPAFVAFAGDYCGTVFRIETDGSGYSVLKHFFRTNFFLEGVNPRGCLAVSGSALYGLTYVGGGGQGTVFKMSTDGSGYTVLKRFTNNAATGESGWPSGGLTLSEETLYGATYGTEYSGLFFNHGTVFKLRTGGTGFSLAKRFAGTDGSGPAGEFCLSGGMLFGTTLSGGSGAGGVLFRLGISPPVLLLGPQSQTVETGSDAGFTVKVGGEPTPSLQWFHNGDPLTGQTSQTLSIIRVGPEHQGAYTVALTNVNGALTSGPAMLSVVPPVTRRTVPAIGLTGDVGSCLHLSCADEPGPGASWQDLDAVTLASSPQFYADCNGPLQPARFYCAWQTNMPNVIPTLEMSLATELTLTGAIGEQVRVEWINQFGPTDAWLTLDTVNLTNTTQRCFDFTRFQQPPRLYRVVPVP